MCRYSSCEKVTMAALQSAPSELQNNCCHGFRYGRYLCWCRLSRCLQQLCVACLHLPTLLLLLVP